MAPKLELMTMWEQLKQRLQLQMILTETFVEGEHSFVLHELQLEVPFAVSDFEFAIAAI